GGNHSMCCPFLWVLAGFSVGVRSRLPVRACVRGDVVSGAASMRFRWGISGLSFRLDGDQLCREDKAETFVAAPDDCGGLLCSGRAGQVGGWPVSTVGA